MFSNLRSLVRRLRSRDLRKEIDSNFIGFDKYTKHGGYHYKTIVDNEYYLSKTKFVESMIQSSSVVVDIGCGDGAMITWLASRHPSTRFFGVDADDCGIKIAQEEVKRLGLLNVTLQTALISDLDNSDWGGIADVVYTMDVIEHLPRPAELCRIANHVTNTSGVVIVGTPQFLTPELMSQYHVKEFSKQELTLELQKCFESVVVDEVPDQRLDGLVYEHGFLIAVCR